MLNCLDQVRTGVLATATFQKAEVTRRTLNFNLSSVAVVEPVFTNSVFAMDVDASGRYLLSGTSDGSWYIHDTFNLTGEVDHTKPCVLKYPPGLGTSRGISTVQWFATDSGLFSTSHFTGKLFIWDSNAVADGPVDKYNLGSRITRHQMNPISKTSVAACAGGKVSLIDLRSGSAIQKLPETMTFSKELAWNPGNEFQLLVGSDQGHLFEWDIRSTFSYRSYSRFQSQIARRGVRTRDFQEQVNIVQKAHNGSIASIKFKNNGMEFYTFGDDGQIMRWLADTNPSSDAFVSSLNYGRKSRGHGNYCMGLSGDTDPPLIFAPKGTSISIFDMKECRFLRDLKGHYNQVNCFVYDEIYQQGYSGGNDAAVMVWSGHHLAEQTYLEHRITEPGGTSRTRPGLLIEDDPYYEGEYSNGPDSNDSDEDSIFNNRNRRM